MPDERERQRDLARARRTITVLSVMALMFVLCAAGILVWAIVAGSLPLYVLAASLGVCSWISYGSARRTSRLMERIEKADLIE